MIDPQCRHVKAEIGSFEKKVKHAPVADVTLHKGYAFRCKGFLYVSRGTPRKIIYENHLLDLFLNEPGRRCVSR